MGDAELPIPLELREEEPRPVDPSSAVEPDRDAGRSGKAGAAEVFNVPVKSDVAPVTPPCSHGLGGEGISRVSGVVCMLMVPVAGWKRDSAKERGLHRQARRQAAVVPQHAKLSISGQSRCRACDV